ncbi:ribonuclease [Bacillus thuringiensis serovar subtoxicus]|uniref:Ribonuclease n=1 Tax=Bacillus thuringiensis serovar subtoxicus TaxID=475791 RepID=A0A9X6IIB9_BACTU|nr:ribonuclease [Bacillus thuringiensis serovar subtoxicus]
MAYVLGQALGGTLVWFAIIAIFTSLILLIIGLINKKRKKPLFMRSAITFGIAIVSFVILFVVIFVSMSIENKDKEIAEEKKKESEEIVESLSPSEDKNENQQNTKNEQPNKSLKEFTAELQKPIQNEHPIQAESIEQPKQEETKTNVNSDKSTYENEIKPQIDSMIKEYDEIWNQEWKPVWAEIINNIQSANPTDPNTLKEKMSLISSKYDALSKKNTEFKAVEKLNDPILKEKIEKFRVEFGLATNYRSNATNAVRQGVQGVAPMKGRMEEAMKSIELSDQKIINASVNLVEAENKLGIKRN